MIAENTTNIFDEQTGIFVSACRHGIIQNPYSVKYALATANKLIDIYGPNGVTGYDVGCSFSKTLTASSITDKVKRLNHRFVVNSFHGHTHNHCCQLQYHTLYQEGLGIKDLETCKHVFSGSNAVAPLICQKNTVQLHTSSAPARILPGSSLDQPAVLITSSKVVALANGTATVEQN
ncbi:hypothetical protein F4604DRAFT_1592345 [Suillus subluteus]|nr:hypothetical protein F4604DRAFT_1592345 [Suillus subluteus]